MIQRISVNELNALRRTREVRCYQHRVAPGFIIDEIIDERTMDLMLVIELPWLGYEYWKKFTGMDNLEVFFEMKIDFKTYSYDRDRARLEAEDLLRRWNKRLGSEVAFTIWPPIHRNP